MTRGYWVATVLSLGGWLPLCAQEASWRPVSRPDAPASARLGKPVPTVRGSSLVPDQSPRLFPPAYRDSKMIAGREAPAQPGVQPIASVAPGSTVIAVSSPSPAASLAPPVEDDHGLVGDQFAMDRPRGVVPALRPAANWVQPHTADAPPPGTVPVPVPAPQPLPQGALLGSPFADVGAGPGRFYVRGEYLLWWIKNDHAPPLVTTGDPNNPINPGALGQPDTVVLHDGRLNRSTFSGARLTAGYWLDDCGDKAVELSGFFLGQKSDRFSASSAQFPVLTRPFFNLNLGMEDVEQVAFPGVATGRVAVDAPSQLWGLDANLICKCCCACNYQVNALAGFRYLNLRESLTITEDIQNLPFNPATNNNFDPFNGTRSLVSDSFATRNQFYGGQVGLDGRWQFGRLSLDARGTIALGATQQTVSINGFQRFPPGTPNVDPQPGGLLTSATNIGTRSRTRFSYVPEGRLALGYQLTDRIRATVGYNIMYWSSVARPGGQIDRGLDSNRIPNFNPPNMQDPPINMARPAPLINSTDFWAHGLTLGLEITF